MEQSDRQIIEGLRPYVIARPTVRHVLRTSPLGFRLSPECFFDPLRVDSAWLIDRIQIFDRLSFGPAGLSMPRWALYDCAGLPGVLFGLGVDAERAAPALRTAFAQAAGLLPLTLAIGIPTVDPRCWLVYSLSALEGVSTEVLAPRTRLLTLAMLAAMIPCDRLVVITQWRSNQFSDYARFAPLELRAAWLPSHDQPATAVFEIDASPTAIERALGPSPLVEEAPQLELDDDRALLALQEQIEGGERIQVLGPPSDGRITIRRGGRR